jgi:hypothetical protein
VFDRQAVSVAVAQQSVGIVADDLGGEPGVASQQGVNAVERGRYAAVYGKEGEKPVAGEIIGCRFGEPGGAQELGDQTVDGLYLSSASGTGENNRLPKTARACSPPGSERRSGM